MDVRETLRQAVEMGASDIFIIAGLPLTYKVDGRQRRMEARLMPADTAAVISDIYTLCGRSRSRIEREDEVAALRDFAGLPGMISDVSGRMFCISAAALRRSFV